MYCTEISGVEEEMNAIRLKPTRASTGTLNHRTKRKWTAIVCMLQWIYCGGTENSLENLHQLRWQSGIYADGSSIVEQTKQQRQCMQNESTRYRKWNYIIFWSTEAFMLHASVLLALHMITINVFNSFITACSGICLLPAHMETWKSHRSTNIE